MAQRLPDRLDSTDTPHIYADREAGDFFWDLRNERRELAIAIPWPSGASVWCNWPISPHTTKDGNSWEWDGNVESPTLRPSLHWVGVWHGYIENGTIREA